ncbi:MAG: hypothetical protein ACYTHJ_18270 [Planctomycetota bacterium]|jgi:uncharacterized membrane protein HdeD (DUF308 family)
MSLKAFHLVFVIVCVFFLGGFGAWCISHFRDTGEVSALVVGILSILGGVLAIVYARWFLRKLERFSYL